MFKEAVVQLARFELIDPLVPLVQAVGDMAVLTFRL
jgi:hypothetical protein